jgi:hypothetical protein
MENRERKQNEVDETRVCGCCFEPEPSAFEYEITEEHQLRRDIDAIIQRIKNLPGSSERSLSITRLQEAILWIGMDLTRLHELDLYSSSKKVPDTGAMMEPPRTA